MPGRTLVNISSNTIHRNVTDADDQFDVLGNISLVLRAMDTLTDDLLSGSGLVRNSGTTTIDDQLLLDDTVTFANASAVTQNDTTLQIGEVASDAATVRNDGGAT